MAQKGKEYKSATAKKAPRKETAKSKAAPRRAKFRALKGYSV